MGRPFLGELSYRQVAFCIAYVNNGRDHVRAVIQAGYTGTARSIARKLLSKKGVQMFIKEYVEKAEKELEIDVKWKMKNLKAMVLAGIEEVDSKNPKIINHKAVLGAIQELNKMSGDYAPIKAEVDTKLAKFDKKEFDELFKQCDEAYSA